MVVHRLDDDHLLLFVSLLMFEESDPGSADAVTDGACEGGAGGSRGGLASMPLCTLCCTVLCALFLHIVHSLGAVGAPEDSAGSKFLQ